MAAISRIQIANFLSDGYEHGKEWMPLYRGETFRLWGQPAAMQIDNGGGKTSLTEACLYLLTRTKSRRLRSRVEDRTAPFDKGWTHVRIEFVEKPHDEDILQADLITLDPVDVPGIPYVVGMCWNRTKDPHFYSYQGTFEDAPSFTREVNGLTLIANDVFRKSVVNMPGSKWNRWKDQAEWLDEIRQFTNVEVLLQNVEFQLKGAGDYSAMINEVKPEANETYDTAFFRQFVAPELLKHAMVPPELLARSKGEDHDDKDTEKGFEDTILLTLQPAANALLDIGKRQRELDETKVALRKFDPVLEKAGEVVVTNTDYERELNTIACNASIVHALAAGSPVPGIPIIPPGTQWASDKRVLAALGHMVIDKAHGTVITDAGLAEMIGIETRRLNERSGELKLSIVPMGPEALDLEADLKNRISSVSAEGSRHEIRQPIENKADLKQKRGGRRYETKCYALKESLTLIEAVTNFAGAKTAGLADVLTRAFGIAADEIDTNPYRKQLRQFDIELAGQNRRLQEAKTDYQRYQQEYEALIDQGREAEENQIAYEGFAARKNEFPEEYWGSPVSALEWAKSDAKQASDNLNEHGRLTGERQEGYKLWNKLTEKHGLASLPDTLESLNGNHNDIVKAHNEAQRKLKETNQVLVGKRNELSAENKNLDVAKNRLARLDGLATSMPVFTEVFGDADPLTLDPQGETKTRQEAQRKNDRLLQDAFAKKKELLDFLPKTKLYGEIFGEADPDTLNPSKDLAGHMQAISVEENIVTEYLPFMEALALFRERHPALSPDEWLTQTAEHRRVLAEERAKNLLRINDLEGELADLTAFGAADDRVYAKAIKLLGENGIMFDRLHELACRTVQGGRLEQCLTLFSAFLSAPVIDSIEKAGEAATLLEGAKLTVPIFLSAALKSFLLDGDITQSGEIAHAIWAGRRTRQVDVLLNPSLIEEEKTRAQEEIEAFAKRNETIQGLLGDISEESDAVRTALDAKTAIQKESERIYGAASQKLEQLHRNTPGLERRAAIDAQEAVSAMKRYIRLGGDARYNELVNDTIPGLESEQGQIKTRLEILATQTTEQALRALHSAKDFLAAGGREAHEAARIEFSRLDDLVKLLEAGIAELQSMVNGELSEAATNASEALRHENETYALNKRDLEAAIDFETKGFVTFMKNAAARWGELEGASGVAQKRLQGIDFDRAERYLISSRSETRSLAERIAEAKGNRDNAEQAETTASNEITRLEGDMATIKPFMDMMHDMVVAIRAQHTKIAMFSEDIRQRMRAAQFSDPEILGYAETVRIACLGGVPVAGQEINDAMWNLRRSVEDLEINTGELRRMAETRQRLFGEYIHRRDDFCKRAKSGEIRGLNELEIAAIAEAKTIEQLQRIREAQGAIESQIADLESDLAKIREAMEANKKASIDNLTTLATSAQTSLDILERVMKKTPTARFHVEAKVADDKEIEKIITGLLAQIEDKERTIRERGVVLLNDEIERKVADYRLLINDTIYKRIFSPHDKDGKTIIHPRVYFTHASIRGKEKVPFTDHRISTGQHTALAMMWLIKQADFAIARAASLYGTAKERKAALRGAQRIMFFDGLFSNLSNEAYINDAFQGLGGVGENFQLIGLIHNPHYVNNKDIFPVHLVGRKMIANKGDKNRERMFVSVEPWQDSNGILLYTSAYKCDSRATNPEHMDA